MGWLLVWDLQVAQVIYQRLAEGSTPGNRTDGLKIALALEGGEFLQAVVRGWRWRGGGQGGQYGNLSICVTHAVLCVCAGCRLGAGGMRGCVGSGMLAALTHLGMRDVFDVIYGSSAGRQAAGAHGYDKAGAGVVRPTEGRTVRYARSRALVCVGWWLAQAR